MWLPKSPRARRRLILLAAIAPVLALAAGLTLWGMRDAISYFYTPSQAKAANPPPGRAVQLGGLVVAGSVKKLAGGRVDFVVADRSATTPVSFQGDLPDPAQQLGDGQAARLVDAQGQGFDEEADQRLQLGAGTSGHRGADQYRRLAGEPAKQGPPGGQQGHERGAAMAAAEGFEVAAESRVQLEAEVGTGEVLGGRAWPVQGQVDQRRCVGELDAPVVGLPLQVFAGQPAALPGGVVRVLDRQGRQWIVESLGEGVVERGEFATQHAGGPAVGDDVVLDDQQQVFAFGDA